MAPPRATFRRHERLRDARAFQRAFERRRSASDERLIVYAVENGLDHPRLGISLGRKKVRLATARGRIKRLLREAFRLNKANLPVGIDLVIVPRGGGLTFAEAMRSLPALARAAAARLGTRPPPPRKP